MFSSKLHLISLLCQAGNSVKRGVVVGIKASQDPNLHLNPWNL